MTVLGSLTKRSIEDPSQPISSASLASWLSGSSTTAGVSVSEDKVMGLTAWYRGLSLISGTIGSLPIHVYKNGTRERIRQRTVLDSPNPRQTPSEFWQTMALCAVSWGNAFARKIRNGSDVVVEVWPIHPSRVRIEEVDPTPDNPAGKVFHVRTATGTEKKFTSWDIFHLPYISRDGVSGLSPLRLARQTLGIGIAAEQASASFYANGSRIQGLLRTEQELSDERADRIQSRWRQKHAGSQNAGDIVVMDKGMEFQAISLPPQDAQLLESREWTVEEVARLLGLPPHMLGAVAKSTSWGTGIESQFMGWLKTGLQPVLTNIEQRTTRELLPGGWTSGSWYAEFLVDALLRPDSQTRSLIYSRAVQFGWMSRNEIRVRENLEPAEGLDEFLTPSYIIGAETVNLNKELLEQKIEGEQNAQPNDG